jgi:putative restriction endonuclease
MASIPARSATALWPPDDTEESIVGVDRHQLDIISLRTGINEEAHRLAGDGPVRWQAISQIMYLGCVRPDGSPYTLYPDVFVFPRSMDRTRSSYMLRQDGPPVLVVEVASDSTYEADLDLERGKGWSYQHVGVLEYLVLDPTGIFVPGTGRGWRLAGGVYVPWERDTAGRWRSEVIGVSFGVEDGLAAAYGAGGRRHLREGEIGAALAAQRAEGEAAGRQEGQVEGKREALRRLARLRFGAAALERRIATADDEELDSLLERIVVAAGPDDI